MSVEIPDLSVEDGDTCTVEATVVTGFETLAKQECEQKLGTTALVSRGRIVFQIPIKISDKVMQLKSIDNAYVVIYNNNNVDLSAQKEECMSCLIQLIGECGWKKGLDVWSRVRGNTEDGENLKFRVSCNRANGPDAGGKHSFSSPDAAIRFGSAVQEHFKWKADMTKFDVEVVLNVVSFQVYICIALTKESLHRRNIIDFGWTTLKSTVAYNLLQLAAVEEGDVVCDPMCGSGAIPIESALNWSQNIQLCGDCHPVAVNKTANNLKNSSGISLDVLNWDVTHLPLRDNSVDVFVSDLPFGKRSGSKADNRVLYPKLLLEMARSCRTPRGRAVLLTQDRRSMTRALQKTAALWKQSKLITINLGGLLAGVYLLHRKVSQGNS